MGFSASVGGLPLSHLLERLQRPQQPGPNFLSSVVFYEALGALIQAGGDPLQGLEERMKIMVVGESFAMGLR